LSFDSGEFRIALQNWDASVKGWTVPRFPNFDVMALEGLDGRAIPRQRWEIDRAENLIIVKWKSDDPPPVDALGVATFHKRSALQKLTEPVVVVAFIGLIGTLATVSMPYITSRSASKNLIDQTYSEAQRAGCPDVKNDPGQTIKSCIDSYSQLRLENTKQQQDYKTLQDNFRNMSLNCGK
jgi:hypothetical protein